MNVSKKNNNQFNFNISLSVLNHLGRNLYRNSITVLGEAISNSWDADAENVWIYVDKENNNFVIKDDGVGMSEEDFQDKFLKTGYSKRKGGKISSRKSRPYIGRKGIGKLALLSCAEKISVISKIQNQSYVGGVIDNQDLDRAINDDLPSTEYALGIVDDDIFTPYIPNHTEGTIIYFEKIDNRVRSTLDHLKKVMALYFRFSLLDESFNMFLNDEKITQEHLSDLASRTEFSWLINEFNDPYVRTLNSAKEKPINLSISNKTIMGFIAATEYPRYLNIFGSGEKIGVDIFVNGRLREVNILKHKPAFATRHIASYLYGQIHFNELDDDEDRFTSNREGIVPGDDKYTRCLEILENEVLKSISGEWDILRDKHKQPSDPDNHTKERRAKDLFNVVSKVYAVGASLPDKMPINNWVDDLADDAQFNFSSYAECFIAENLIRKYITEKKISLSEEAKKEAEKWRSAEIGHKQKGNISIRIRKYDSDSYYLSMDALAYLIDTKDKGMFESSANLSRDADAYKPIRNALAHTSLLTDVAKNKLNSIYENLKARLQELFKDGSKK